MDAYSLAKALHFVSIVSWFAGLFYLGRLFIYHAEALQKPAPDRDVLSAQYTLMEGRLWRAITAPAAFAVLLTGGWLLYLTGAWRLPWFHLKAVFLVLLFAYHGASNGLRMRLAKGEARSIRFYRFWNESATLLLFAIVFTAVFKRMAGLGYGLIAVAILTTFGMTVFVLSRRRSRG